MNRKLYISTVLIFLISAFPVILLTANLIATGLSLSGILLIIVSAAAVSFLSGWFVDLIQKKNMTQRLHSSVDKKVWSEFFEDFPENMIFVNPQTGIIIDINKEACLSVRTEKENLLGMRCVNKTDNGHEPEEKYLISFIEAEIQNGELVILEPQSFLEIYCKEEVVRHNEFFNRHIFQDLPIPMVRMTFTGEFISANDSFFSLMNIPKDILLSEINSTVFFKNSVEREFLNEKIKKEEIVRNMELHFRKYDGGDLDALVTAYSMLDGKGEKFIEGSLFDITTLKQLEKEQRKLESLRYRNKYMDSINKLAAGIAHDINNILAGIQGHAQVIQYRLKKEDPLINSVERITSAVNRADVILQGLMSSIGAYDYNPVTVELGAFIRKTMLDIEAELSIKNRYRIINMDGAVQTSVDPVLMKEAVIELIKNAFNATGGRDEILITIAVEKPHDVISSFLPDVEEKCASLSIIDKGPGMSPETKEKIFEPYFTTKDFGSGAGLGMTKVYGIVQKHDGAIGIFNEPRGGTAVSLFFKL